jgi:hypothetical protein
MTPNYYPVKVCRGDGTEETRYVTVPEDDEEA